MIWGSREECHRPSTVGEWKNFWPRCYTKEVLDTLSNFAIKSRYIVYQHKLVFNLVKDLFKWFEGLGRSVTVRVQSESERIFDLGGIRKKYSIRCQISRSKTRYIVFQHKLHFQPSQGLIQMLWGSREECHGPSIVWEWKIFDLGGIRKSTRYVVKFRAQKLAI